MHFVYPPAKKKKKICVTFVFDFSWDDCNIQEKLEKTQGYAKF